MAVIDVVKWDSCSNDVFAWKFPSQELGTWTQLIVSESQEAVLLKEGQMVGPFGPGKHTLSTKNYPILTSVLKIATGKSPFTAEVWFIQKAFKLDVNWGTPSPIQLEDPTYHIMLPVRAYGQYGLVVEDSAKFLIKMVGTLTSFNSSDLARYFKGIVVTQVKDIIAKYLINKNVSILKIGAELLDISNQVEQSVCAVLDDYGVKVVNFNVCGISTDDNDSAVKKLREALASRAEMDILGFNYQQKRSFDTMEKAAGNTGNGGVMNAGIGMGLGVGIGVPFGNMAQNMTQNMQYAQPCPHCGAAIVPGNDFCPKCGKSTKVEVAGKTCKKCGKKTSAGIRFCPECGAPLFNSCHKCGKEIPDGVCFCPECGARLIPQCPKCGKDITDSTPFCPNCGQKIS